MKLFQNNQGKTKEQVRDSLVMISLSLSFLTGFILALLTS